MPASEIRKNAREALQGKWGKAVCITLVFMALSFIVAFVQRMIGEDSVFYAIIDLAYLVISIPLSFGFVISFMKLKREEDVSYFDFFKDGFSNFGRAWGIWFHTFIRLLLPIVCMILIVILMSFLIYFNTIRVLTASTVSSPSIAILGLLGVVLYIIGIIYIVSRALLYSLAYNIGYDNPELSAKACVLKSEALMKGNRGNLLLLELSFIGWAILACFTLGIGFLWLFPYMQVALVCFYEKVAKPDEKKTEEDKIEE